MIDNGSSGSAAKALTGRHGRTATGARRYRGGSSRSACSRSCSARRIGCITPSPTHGQSEEHRARLPRLSRSDISARHPAGGGSYTGSSTPCGSPTTTRRSKAIPLDRIHRGRGGRRAPSTTPDSRTAGHGAWRGAASTRSSRPAWRSAPAPDRGARPTPSWSAGCSCPQVVTARAADGAVHVHGGHRYWVAREPGPASSPGQPGRPAQGGRALSGRRPDPARPCSHRGLPEGRLIARAKTAQRPSRCCPSPPPRKSSESGSGAFKKRGAIESELKIHRPMSQRDLVALVDEVAGTRHGRGEFAGAQARPAIETRSGGGARPGPGGVARRGRGGRAVGGRSPSSCEFGGSGVNGRRNVMRKRLLRKRSPRLAGERRRIRGRGRHQRADRRRWPSRYGRWPSVS